MSYIYNRNHNRTHLPGCRAISMMNIKKNAEVVEEIQGHACKWCMGKMMADQGLNKSLDGYFEEALVK